MAAATKVTIMAGAKKGAGIVLAKFGVVQTGMVLADTGAGTWRGQYAGPEWPFRCDQKPTYVISGGWILDRTPDQRLIVGPGSALRLTKTNGCGNSMMDTTSTSQPVLPPRPQTRQP